jgi:hypothetical protein
MLIVPDLVNKFPTYWSPKVHHPIHNSSSPLAILNRLNAVNTFVFIDLEILIECGLRARGAVSALAHNIMACTDTILPLTKALICQQYLPFSCLY